MAHRLRRGGAAAASDANDLTPTTGARGTNGAAAAPLAKDQPAPAPSTQASADAAAAAAATASAGFAAASDAEDLGRAMDAGRERRGEGGHRPNRARHGAARRDEPLVAAEGDAELAEGRAAARIEAEEQSRLGHVMAGMASRQQDQGARGCPT